MNKVKVIKKGSKSEDRRRKGDDGIMMTRGKGESAKSYQVSDIRQISPSQITCKATLMGKNGPTASAYGQGGFLHAKHFDFDVALRAAFENAADRTGSGGSSAFT